MSRTHLVQSIAWSLSASAAVISLVVWGQNRDWQLADLTLYGLFPLLGLLAFSLMWAHYVAGAIREMVGVESGALSRYFAWTSYVVLICLALHPGLLIYQLFKAGAGLPPGSYKAYVGPGLAWVAMLGTVCLLVFLAFEFYRWFKDRAWWHWVADASDLAMLGIVYHGFRLGSDLQSGWFVYVWWFFAISLVLVLLRKYWLRLGDAANGPNGKKPSS